MVINGMYQFTNWQYPEKLLLTCYGVISFKKWLLQLKKENQSSEIFEENKKIALFVKGEKSQLQYEKLS